LHKVNCSAGNPVYSDLLFTGLYTQNYSNYH